MKRAEKVWTEDRWKQLEDLELLLRECEGINNSNLVIERLQRIISLAESLRKSDLRARQQSFINFLKGMAIEDAAAPLPPPAQEPQK